MSDKIELIKALTGVLNVKIHIIEEVNTNGVISTESFDRPLSLEASPLEQFEIDIIKSLILSLAESTCEELGVKPKQEDDI